MLAALRLHAPGLLRLGAFTPHVRRTLGRLLACRTAALGRHTCACLACGWQGLAYNSCRDRHCPQCQGRDTHDWLTARLAAIVPTPHHQVVFTLPAALRPVARHNARRVYDLMFRAAASVLKDLADQRLQATLGMTAVLHTWARDLSYHPHVHLLVTAGGLHHDQTRWVTPKGRYLFPQCVLGALFRGRVLQGLWAAFDAHALQPAPDGSRRELRQLLVAVSRRKRPWIAHIEPPAGRNPAHAFKYLARYVKRVAISDARIVSVTDTHVSFRGRHGVVTLTGEVFVRRYAAHILPKGLRKVRHYGLYAPGRGTGRLELARRLAPVVDDTPVAEATPARAAQNETCPTCGKAGLRRVGPGAAPWWLQTLAHRRARGPP